MSSNAPAIHATAISINAQGVLLTGPSGSGKSDLALRLIDRGAQLVCDDYVVLDSGSEPPVMLQAPNISGRIEVRELGIVTMDHVDAIPARLLVMLGDEGERMPAKMETADIAGCTLPVLRIDPFHASAPIKVELALKSVVDQDTTQVPRKP